MMGQNIFFTISLLLCLITSIILCNLNNKSIFSKLKLEISVLFLPIICLISYSSLFWSNLDFVSEVSALKFIFTFISVVLFSLLSFFSSKYFISIIGAVTLSSIVVFGFGYNPQILPTQSLLINQILLVSFWCFITLSFRILNIISGIIYGQTSIFCIGIYILYVIGCAPEIFGFTALCVGISSLVFTIKYWPQTDNVTLNKQVDVLGFMVGAIFAIGSTETLTSPLLIFILFPLCEILIALLKKAFFIADWKNIYQNTSIAKALYFGLPPKITAHHFLRINLLLIVIGCFQSFAPNQYSLLPISIIICFWQMYRLSNWQTLSDGWIDNSKKIHEEASNTLSAIKRNLRKEK